MEKKYKYVYSITVAPAWGAWIEIGLIDGIPKDYSVAPAWERIEIKIAHLKRHCLVAPCMGSVD